MINYNTKLKGYKIIILSSKLDRILLELINYK